MPVTLIIPTRTQPYLQHLLDSLSKYQAGWVLSANVKVVVADNGLPAPYVHWLENIGVTVVGVPQPFCFAKAVNSAAAQALHGSHLIVMNDDAAFASERPLDTAIERMEQAEKQGFGLLGTQVLGGVGNPDQQRADIPYRVLQETQGVICFVCALIPRSTWDGVGPMDDRYTGYGYEDNDYSNRVLREGLKLGVTGDVKVTHGFDGMPFQSTYGKLHDGATIAQMSKRAKKQYTDKWGTPGMSLR